MFRGIFLRSNVLKLLKSFTRHKSQLVKSIDKVQNKNVTLDFVHKLSAIVGTNNISTALAVRKQSGVDEGYRGSAPADVVVFPESVGEISEIAKLCSSFSVPMVPRGAGTGLEHGVGALMGGVCIVVSNMNSVIEVNEEDFDCTVEPGMSRKTLASHLRHTGLWFPVDPGADASIGGMASTSASGTNAVKYGTMKENILNLEVVLADGSILHTAGSGRRSRKSSAGYNLTELFVGSEGTLGIISKVTLRLHAVPQTMVSARCSFPSISSAVQTAVQILQNNIPIARVELLDDLSMSIANKYYNLDCPITPTLFFEFHGSGESDVRSQALHVEELIKMNEGFGFSWSADSDERNKMWEARHGIYRATLAYKKGSRCTTTDACVPISNLTEIIVKTKEQIKESKLSATIVGHVGDGNFHTQILYYPDNEEEFKAAKALEENISMLALSLNGTCTGEHGIGTGKIGMLEQELGPVGMQTMQSIKKALDPHNLMNPGKVINI